MSKKFGNMAMGIAIGFGLIVTAIVWVYNNLPVLFWMAVIMFFFYAFSSVGVKALLIMCPDDSSESRKKRYGAKQEYEHKTISVRHPETGEWIIETDWEAQFVEIDAIM